MIRIWTQSDWHCRTHKPPEDSVQIQSILCLLRYNHAALQRSDLWRHFQFPQTVWFEFGASTTLSISLYQNSDWYRKQHMSFDRSQCEHWCQPAVAPSKLEWYWTNMLCQGITPNSQKVHCVFQLSGGSRRQVSTQGKVGGSLVQRGTVKAANAHKMTFSRPLTCVILPIIGPFSRPESNQAQIVQQLTNALI